MAALELLELRGGVIVAAAAVAIAVALVAAVAEV